MSALTRYSLTGVGRSAMFADDSARGRIQRCLDNGSALTCPEIVRASSKPHPIVRREISRMLLDCQLRRVTE